MHILVYCQHVLGIGHLFRTIEILKALHGHQVTLVLGGPEAKLTFPDHVRVIQLPGLKMDKEFSGLNPVDTGCSLEEIKETRKEQLLDIFKQLQPQVLLVELFPFGRNAFRFELEPLLKSAKDTSGHCRTACSVRDILVERDNPQKFEQRVIDRLNRYFDLLLIHSDPDIIKLDATFFRMNDISIPVHYTGFIGRHNTANNNKTNTTIQPGPKQKTPLIVASAGGGNVGFPLLKAVIAAHRFLQEQTACRLQLFTGPYLEDQEYSILTQSAGADANIDRFAEDFPRWLGKAALSVSMGGYNTTMDILNAGCPSIIYPFGQNHEQRFRAERLAAFAPISILNEEDLNPIRLAQQIKKMLKVKPSTLSIKTEGAARTAQLLTSENEPIEHCHG